MNELIKYEAFELAKQDIAIRIANKMLEKIENDLPDLIPFRKGNKWGYCDKNRIIKIPCKYDEVSLFSEGLAAVKLWLSIPFTAYIEKSGKAIFVTPYGYELVKGFKNGIAIVSSNKKYGIINNLGKVICECKYEYIPDFRKNRAIVNLNYRYGVIDASGQILIDAKYDDIYSEENIFILRLGKKWGIFDLDGNMVQDFLFDWVSNYFSEGYARIYKKDKYGFIDTNGKLVIDCLYESIDIMGSVVDKDFENGFAWVINFSTGEKGYIDYSGKWYDDKPNQLSASLAKIYNSQTDFYGEKPGVEKRFVYSRAGELQEGLAWVRLNGKWGFVNKEGDLVIDCIYEGAHSFHDNVAWVELNGKWGVIDKTANIIIDFLYQNYLGLADGFNEGVCIVALNNKFGVIDKSGKIIINCIYDMISRKRTSGFFEAEIKTENWKRPTGDSLKDFQNNQINICRSLFDISGKVIIHDYFGYILDFEEGLIKISKGYVDKNGNQYWED